MTSSESRPLTPRELLVTALGFLALSLAFIFPAGLSRSKFLGTSDALCSYFPYMVRSFQPVSPGVAGAWDPTLYTGLPESHSPFGRYYPPTLLLYTALPPALALCFSLVFHQAWAGLGTYLLTRDGGRSRSAAWLAGVVFGFGGFMVFHRSHIPMYECGSWLPWILWSLGRLRRQPSFTGVVIIGSFLALQALAGQTQFVVMGGLVWLTYLVYFTFVPARPWRARRRFLLGGLAACVLGALGSLPQMLPMLEVASWSPYGKFDPEFFNNGSLEWRFLAGLVGPWTLGGGFGASSPTAYWGLTEHGTFYGVLPLVVAIAGLIALGLRRWQPAASFSSAPPQETPFWLFLLGASLLLMLGGNTPVYGLLAYVPVYRLFHVPPRHVWIFGLALAWLCAYGLDCLHQAEPAPRRRLLRWTAAAVLLLLAGCALMVGTISSWPDCPRLSYPGFWIPLFSSAAALLYLAAEGPWLVRLLPLLAFVELWVSIGDYELANGPPDALTQPAHFPEVVRKLHELEPGPLPPRCLIRAEWWQAAGRDWWVPAELGSAWGLASLNNYSQSMPHSLARLLLLDRFGHADFPELLKGERRLSAASGRWIVARGPNEDHELPYPVVARCEPDYVIYENPAARPLATLVREVRPAATDLDAVDGISTTGPPVREIAYVTAPSGSSLDWRIPGPQAFASGAARLRSDRPDDIGIDTAADGDAFLVLTVTRCKGWSAAVDGQDMPIHAVDGPFMGVRVPAGRHVVRFHFRPVLLWAGAGIASLALGSAWLAVLLLHLKSAARGLAPAPRQQLQGVIVVDSF